MFEYIPISIYGKGSNAPQHRHTTDLATISTAALLLLVTAVVASWLPARRAGRTNPIEILKAE